MCQPKSKNKSSNVFWAIFVKVSPSLSKGRSSKISFCGICKISQPLSKIGPGTFFWFDLDKYVNQNQKNLGDAKKINFRNFLCCISKNEPTKVKK